MTDSTPPAAAAAAPLSEADDRQWASFAHLGGIIGILPALIIYLVFKDRGAFTRTESKEALNFQITILGAQIALYILGTLLSVVLIGIIFFPLAWLVYLAGAIFSIVAFLKAKEGVSYRYPFAIRLIK